MTWLFGEAPLPPSESLVGPETVGFAFVQLDVQDPGVQALQRHTMVKLRQGLLNRPDLPASLRAMISRLVPQPDAMLPMQLVITDDVDENQADKPVVTTYTLTFGHLRGLSQMLFWSLQKAARQQGETSSQYQDYPIVHLTEVPEAGSNHRPETSYIAYLSNSYVVSSSLDGVELAIDRLRSQNGSFRGKGPLAAMYGLLNHRQDLLGVTSSQHGEVRRLLGTLVSTGVSASGGANAEPIITPALVEVAANGVDVVGWELDILSEQEAELHLTIDCQSAAFAEHLRDFVDQALQDFVNAKRATAKDVRLRERRLTASIRFTRLDEMISHLVPPSAPGSVSPSPSPSASPSPLAQASSASPPGGPTTQE